MNKDLIFKYAKDVSLNACTLTKFSVGAALVTADNKIYTGCNIENAGIQSICAERVAFVKALSNGEREFKEIYVVGKGENDKCFIETLPCGYCRQFMKSYVNDDFKILATAVCISPINCNLSSYCFFICLKNSNIAATVAARLYPSTHQR